MAEIKLSDLPWGGLNNIQDNSDGLSGDRRRTNTTTALRLSVEAAYSRDTLNNINEFNGVIVSYRPVAYASYKNRTAMFENYVYSENPDGEEEQKPKDYATFAYKVYIPELECRPVPQHFQDPVLVTYPDVYSDIEGTANLPLELGTLVAVKYEDVDNLFNPRIIRKVGGPIQIQNIASAELNKAFRTGIPKALGQSGPGSNVGYTGDSKAYPVTQTKIYTTDFFAPSDYKTNLAGKINTLDKSVQEKFAQAIKSFLTKYFDEGLDVKITYGYRNLAEQQRLKNTTAGPVASAGYSWHNYGAAVDILIYDKALGKWDEGKTSIKNYTEKARGIFEQWGLINDIPNDVGHFYPKEFGRSPHRALRTGGGSPTLESLIT